RHIIKPNLISSAPPHPGKGGQGHMSF
ncbi:levansucrase regulator, partial [Salmonella sp. 741265096_HSA]